MSLLEQNSFLAAVHPFDRLATDERERVANALDIGYFGSGEVLIKPGDTPQQLYLIIKGVVRETGDDGSALYAHQDSFDAIALMEGHSRHRFVVEEELLCYLLPRAVFLDIARSNEQFRAYYYEDISQKLEARVAAQDFRELASFMVARIEEAYLHPPVYVDAQTSIRDAAIAMKANKTASVLVRRDAQVGIATGTDMRDAVVIHGKPADAPIGEIASFPLITLEAREYLFEALLLMTRHGLNRIVITRGEEIIGILEQIDLLSFFSSHSHLINMQVERASNIVDLGVASAEGIRVVRTLNAKGVKMHHLTRLVSELDHKVFRRLYEMVAPADLVESSCLVVMGSEGRGEQILKSDQDNAILLRDGYSCPNLQRVTREFSDALRDFGYPPCPGGIMVSNPYWAKPLADYRDEMFRWVTDGDSEGAMKLAAFYDATAVAGSSELLEDARDYLFGVLADNAAYVAHFAKAILSFDTPLGMFAHLVLGRGDHKDELDIKKGGIFPIVHGVRSLALQKKLRQTNTAQRIQALDEMGLFAPGFASELTEALDYMSQLRLKAMLAKIDAGQPLDNYIRPRGLNKLECELLRDSFKIVNAFKKLVSHHFRLDVLA